MTSFLEDALRAALARGRAAGDADGPAAYRVTPVGSGGVVPGVDLSDSAGLLDLMDHA